MDKFTIASALVCLLTILAQPGESENVLEAFVRDKLENYSSWLKDNKLDPSPVEAGPTYITYSDISTKVDCDLSNHIVKGHSEGINVKSIKADLSTISVSFVMQDVTFSGTYNGSGTVGIFDPVPIEGQGEWNITIKELKFEDVIFNYIVNCNGHVQIISDNLDSITLPTKYSREGEVYFENLWENVEDDFYVDYIKDGVYEAFREYFKLDQNNFLRKTYLQYFQEAFENATWAEIVLPTLPSNNKGASSSRDLVMTNSALGTFEIDENILEKFVREKLNGFPGWIKEKNFDPSPEVVGPTSIASSSWWVKLDCNLSDHFVQDHSQAINITSIKADLNRILVSFKVPGNITFSGNYKANGTVGLDDTPINGDGGWNINVTDLAFRDFYFNYTISPDDHVQINSYDFDGVELPYNYYPETHFEDLWDSLDNSDKTDVQRALYDGYSDYLSGDVQHPLKQMYLEYFQQIFANTTWTDIIVPTPETCATAPTTIPTTARTTTRRTTTPTTTTTTRPTTTRTSTTPTPPTTTPPGNTIVQFVRNKLREYPAWMKAKNLDPSPKVVESTHIYADIFWSIEIDCYLSNHIVENHSDGLYVTSITADLDSISVSLELQQNVTFSGSYVANGTVGMDEKPITGEGTWYIYEPIVVIQNLFLNYSVLSDGHAFITYYKLDGPTLPSYYNSKGQVFFENLWEDGPGAEYNETIQQALYDGFKAYIVKAENHPFKQTYNLYFQEVFANTTWSDIIDPSVPPSSTPTTGEASGSTSTSTEGSKTTSDISDPPKETSSTTSSRTSTPTSTTTENSAQQQQLFTPISILVILSVMAWRY